MPFRWPKDQLSWQQLWVLSCTNFVQVSKRLGDAFCDTSDFAVPQVVCSCDAAQELAGWKALLVLLARAVRSTANAKRFIVCIFDFLL